MVEVLGSVFCVPVLLNYCMIWRKTLQYSESHIPYLSGIVNHVIRLSIFLWLWFQCVCLLMPSHNTYHLTWVSLPWTWGISSQLLQQSTTIAPYLGRVAPPDLERGLAPLGPPAPVQPPLLVRGVAPLGRCPWPPAWYSSSIQIWPKSIPLWLYSGSDK